MKLPNADHAVVDIRKLRDYILSPMHRIGKHKARVFLAALNMTANDAESLRRALLQAAREQEAELGLADDYGQRYQVDFVLEWKGRRAIIRSAWIIEFDTPYPRLTSCYVLEE